MEYKQKLYFNGLDTVNGEQLWVSDGTESGTKLFKIINMGDHSFISDFVLFKQKLCFTANNGVDGYEIWQTDGTAQGTVKLTNLNPQLFVNPPRTLTVYKDRLYFDLNDGITGWELWSTDITPNTAKLLKDINPGTGSSNAHSFTIFRDKLFFIADSDADKFELWYTDGTENGTVKVARPDGATVKNSLCCSSIEFTVYNDALYFPAIYDNRGREVWKCQESKLSVDEVKVANDMFVYPNPANGNEVFFSESLSGQVIDITGRPVFQFEKTDKLDISRLSNGLYFIRTTDGHILKFVIGR